MLLAKLGEDHAGGTCSASRDVFQASAERFFAQALSDDAC